MCTCEHCGKPLGVSPQRGELIAFSELLLVLKFVIFKNGTLNGIRIVVVNITMRDGSTLLRLLMAVIFRIKL